MKGHIRKRRRADGSLAWQARWPNGGHEERCTFDRKKEAQAWLADRQAARLRGDLITPELRQVQFTELVEAWRSTWDGRLQPRTSARYDEILRTHLLPAFGKQLAHSITTQSVHQFMQRLSAQGSAPGTVRKVHSCLSAVFKEALTMGTVRNNPAKGVRLPSVPAREPMFLTGQQLRDIGARASDWGGPQAELAVLLAGYTGMRAGEQWALRRRDVSLLTRRIHITRALKDTRGHLSFGPTKSHQSRAVAFPKSLVPLIEEQLRTADPHPDALLFRGAYGAPIRHNLFVRRVFRPAALAAMSSGEHVRWHDLRHTYASLAAAAGASAKDVQAQLGHSSVTMTLDRYTHLFPAQADTIADRLDAFLTAEEAVA